MSIAGIYTVSSLSIIQTRKKFAVTALKLGYVRANIRGLSNTTAPMHQK